MRGYYLIVFVLLTHFAASSFAAQESAQSKDDIPLLTDEQEQKLDATREDVSEWLIEKALWFDSFFDDESYFSEVNKTRLKVSLKMGYSKKDEWEVKPRASLRINLPRLENKASLILAASDDSEFDAGETPLIDTSLHEDSERNELTAGIKYFLQETLNTNISVSAGVSWDYAYAGLRLRRSKNYGEWRTRFVNKLLYYTDDGWEDRATLELDRPLTEKILFRTALAAEWFEQESGVPHSIGFYFYQFLDKTKALEYQASCFFDTRPNYHVTDVQFRFKFRQRFYRDWLALEVEPFVTFPEDYDRDANPGIIFKLEAIFGYSSE